MNVDELNKQLIEIKYQLIQKECEIEDLKPCQAINESEILRLQKLITESQTSPFNLQSRIGSYFPMLTENQISLMTGEKKRVNWTCDEITKGFALSFFNRRGYNYVVNNLKYPLPSVRTLQEWSEGMSLIPGVVLKDSLTVLKALSSTLSEGQRQVVVAFDEMKCKSLYEHDKTLDRIYGPNDQMQCVIVRGLFAKFKQPIYVNFDEKMTPALLDHLIVKLHEVNLNVVAFVGDNGGGNVGLWKNCDVNFNDTTIKHPITGEDIHMFSDVPHLLKLLRNWFIDGGFQLEDKTILNKAKIREIIETSPEITPLFKVSLHHITLTGSDRQNVRVASQLFSHNVAQYLVKHYPNDMQVQKLSKFIELVNKWFDIFNSYSFYACGYKKPYGLNLVEQDSVLDEMYKTIKSMRCFNKKGELQNSLQIFQKGILMSITSLKLLRSKMNDQFGFKYILTHRLNQDCLENTFSQIRGRSGSHDHPTPIECLQRIKVIMLGKNPGIALQNHSNTIELDPDEYVSATFLKALSEETTAENDSINFNGKSANRNNDVEGSNDWPVEFLEESFMEGDTMPHDFYSDDDRDWPVELLESSSIEIDQIDDSDAVHASDTPYMSNGSNDDFLNETNGLCVELSIEHSFQCTEEDAIRVTELSIDPLQCNEGYSLQVTDEFIEDLENEMPANDFAKRIKRTEEDGLEYIAGWLAFKLKDTTKDCSVSRRTNLPSHITDHTYAQYIGTPSNSWIDSITYGGLTKPSKQLLQWVERLEKEFIRIHGDEFGERSNIIKELISKLQSVCSDISYDVIKLYSKFRIYARCRFLNKKRFEAAILQRIEKRRLKAMVAIKRSNDQNQTDDLSRSKNKKMKKIVL